MSISDEITRLNNAKDSMKAALEKRGGVVSENALVDTFPSVLEGVPYAIKGYFTPETDAKVFSISGLSFEPCAVYIVCNEINNAVVENGVIFLSHGKGLRGGCVAFEDGVKATTNLSENSALAEWGQTSYKIDLSKSSGTMAQWLFKAGYTYEYYISGGFSG